MPVSCLVFILFIFMCLLFDRVFQLPDEQLNFANGFSFFQIDEQVKQAHAFLPHRAMRAFFKLINALAYFSFDFFLPPRRPAFRKNSIVYFFILLRCQI